MEAARLASVPTAQDCEAVTQAAGSSDYAAQRETLASESRLRACAHSTDALPRRLSPPESGALLLLVCVTCLFAGCTCFRRNANDASVVSARQMSLKGIDALQKGKLDDAEAMFADALRQNPTDERAHRHYAEVMWERGQQQAAIHHMEECIRLSGGDPTLLVQLGQMYLGQGNTEAAWDCATEAIDASGRLPCAWALRGDIYRKQGEFDLALESYHRALSEQAHYPHVQMAAAEIYRLQNRPQRALATLDSLAAQLRPEDTPPEVFYQQGLAYKAVGRYQDAILVLTAASRQSSPPADLFYHLAEAQHLAGNSANARLALQNALAQAPTHQPSLQLQDKIERQSQSMTAAIKR